MAVTIFVVKASDIHGKKWQLVQMSSKEQYNYKYPLHKLMSVANILMGQSPLGNTYNDKSQGMPFYQGKTLFSDKYILEPTTWTTEPKKTANYDDILMSVRAPVGNVNLCSLPKICIGRGLASIKAKENVNQFYLFYILDICKHLIKGNHGATFEMIASDELANSQIPIPPLNIQKEIACIMDNAYSEKKRLEAEAKELLNSIDSYVMDKLGIIKTQETKPTEKWFTVKASEIQGKRWDAFYQEFLLLQKFTTPFIKKDLKTIAYMEKGVIYDKDQEKSEGHGILRAGNITLETNQVNFENLNYIDSNVLFSSNKKLLKDDIFICTNSGSKKHVGKVAYSYQDTDFYFGGFMGVLRILKDIECYPLFLFNFLTTTHIRQSIGLLIANTTINNINFSDIAEIKIPIPPQDIQKEIAKECESRRNSAKQKQELSSKILLDAKEKVEAMLFN